MVSRSKLLGITPLMLVVMLSIVGVAYSHWMDSITIEATVNMGSLTLAFYSYEPPACLEYHEVDGKLFPGECEGKDVGKCEAWYDDPVTDDHTGKSGYKTLVINITNAYPQYIVHVIFVIHNIGTIPIDVAGFNITGEKRKGDEYICDLLWDGSGLWEDLNKNGVIDTGDKEVINLSITDNMPFQLDPCNKNKMEIDFEFKQEAEECHTYIIVVTIYGVQWNKSLEV